MPRNIEISEMELHQLKERKKVLSNEFNSSPVSKYIPMITAKGKLKGELDHLTIRQFKVFTGAPPRPSIIVEGKVPWHLAIDTIATEAGYKSDEAFRAAVLKSKEVRDELNSVSKQVREMRQIVAADKEKPLKVEHTEVHGEPPVFPRGGSSREIVTELNGTIIKRKRNPSFWQVESDKDGDGIPDSKVRVRYAEDAKKLVKETVKSEQADYAREHRIPSKRKPLIRRKQIQITPKRQKIR